MLKILASPYRAKSLNRQRQHLRQIPRRNQATNMRMLLRTGVILSVLWLPYAGTAQQLHVRSTKTIAGLGHFIVLPLRCDSGQNVFVWGAEPLGGKLPLVELDAEGKELRQFEITASKRDGIERAFVQAYTVAPDGWLYELLAVPKDRVAVVRFKPTGEYAGAAFLDRSFNSVHLAVFRTGELLVDGTTAAAGDSHEPFMAIFDPTRRLLTED